MAIVIVSIELNERDGRLFIDKFFYDNSFPDYSPESYYNLRKETLPFEEWAESAPWFEWVDLINNTAFDISKIREEKISTNPISDISASHHTDDELDDILNDW